MTQIKMPAEQDFLHWCHVLIFFLLDPSNAQQTLGAYITPDGSGKKQLKVLKEKTRHYGVKSLKKQGGLSNSERWTSYHTVIHLALTYPLMAHSFSDNDLKTNQTLLDQENLHSCGLNEHFPKKMFYMVHGNMGA